MKRETCLLLIDDNPERRRDLALILDFLGEAHLSCSSSQTQDVYEKLKMQFELAGILLGEITGEVCELLKAMDTQIPLLLIGAQENKSWPEDLHRRVLGNLNMPPAYNELLDSLHRMQIYRRICLNGSKQCRQVHLFRSLVGSSRGISEVRKMMQQVADSNTSVLILGESGTGKEVIARNLHYHSARQKAPFVAVNCGAIPADLLESELFGHEKGAFTGAFAARAGRFEQAQGGTLFLDEIGDMPLPMQVKLLRVLQERKFERLGSSKTQNADVRIIAATHRNLEQMIEAGSFREDLYYRLNVFPIEVPPLRERTEDIPLLINELLVRMEAEKRGTIRFNAAAVMSLCHHPWPGNVRELANLIERLCILHPHGVIGLSELPKKFRHLDLGDEQKQLATLQQAIPQNAAASQNASAIQGKLPVEGLDLKDYLGKLEQQLIQQALNDASGVVAHAAERLRVRRTTLVEKMRKYAIQASS